MKKIIFLVITVFLLTSCGSNSETPVDYSGRWTGKIHLDQSKSCVPLDEQYVDLSGKEYTFDVSQLDASQKLVVNDQEGGLYEQYFPDGIDNGEFSVISVDQNFMVGPPTGPTAISFSSIDENVANVEVFVTYNRFCTSYFIGNFSR